MTIDALTRSALKRIHRKLQRLSYVDLVEVDRSLNSRISAHSQYARRLELARRAKVAPIGGVDAALKVLDGGA